MIAGAVADWYFSAGSDRGALLKSPITASLARTLRFHLGSIALGSLVIAFIQVPLRSRNFRTHDQELCFCCC